MLNSNSKLLIGKRGRLWVAALLLLPSMTILSQEMPGPKVEIFAGAELHYRDIFYTKMYDVLVNLTPGVKWHIGDRWQLAGQAIVPVYNDGNYISLCTRFLLKSRVEVQNIYSGFHS